jgi:hypothetical protein
VKRRNGLEPGLVFDAREACAPVDLLHESGQNGPGTHFNICADALGRKPLHDVLPAHRRGHLADQRVDGRRGIALRFRIDVCNDGDSRGLDGQRAQLGRQPLLGRLHECAMKRGADRQRNHTFGAERLRALSGPPDRFRAARDHDLSWRVQVCGADHVPLRRLDAGLRDERGVQTKDRRHRAAADRDGLLHVPPSIADDAHGIGEGEGAGGNVRGILTEAVARNNRRLDAAARQQALDRNRHRQDRRLGILGERQGVIGAVEDRAAERHAERLVGFREGLATDRERGGERLAHADALRALPWEYECKHHASSALRRSRNPAAANRCVIAIALRIALGPDRPWPTTHSRATPTSGAPPDSE